MKKTMMVYLAAASAGAVFGAAQPVVDTDMVFPAEYVEDFALDGDVTKEVWKQATVLPGQMYQGGTRPMQYKDEIRVLYSKTALYVGATLWQDLSKASFKWDQRDMPTWEDDNLELFLFLPMANGKNGLYQFVINPLGTVADLLDGNIVWSNDGIEVRVLRLADRWTVECRIPFAGMPMDRPVAGDFVGARFCRWVHDGKDRYHCTSPYLIDAGNDQRGRFAKLLFRPPTGPGAEAVLAADKAYRIDLQRKRFYKKYEAFLRRFDEVKGGSEYFKRSTHPLHRKALAEVGKMAKVLSDFEDKWKDALKDRAAVDAGAADAFLASADAFDRYAADNAYAVWIADPWSFGAETDLPPADAPSMPAKLAFEQAGNEREQICLELTGLLCGSRLDLRFWPEAIGTKGYAYSPKGQYLSSDSFEVYVEPFVQVEGEVVTMPLVRADGNIVTVTPGRTVRVWIVFNSRGVPADTYRTMLKFKSLNDLQVATREVPLEAKVWAFALPETRDWPLKSFFWGSFSFNNDEAAQLELAWNCHITHGWTQHHRYQYGLTRENHIWYSARQGKAKRDPAHDFDDDVLAAGNRGFFEKARELGMRFVFGWGTPKSLDWYKAMTKRLLDMGFSYEDFVFKGLLRDEFVKADIPQEAKLREAVWNWNTNLHFQATVLSTPPPTGSTVQDMVDAKLPQFYTQWTVIDGLFDDPVRGPATLKMIRDAGKEAWSYNCARFMHKKGIRTYYRLYPWRCWLRGLDGVAMWTFGPGAGDGWDSRDGFDDGICWRGTDRRCVPTKHLFAFREGLEDVAYMDLLEKALRAERTKGKSHPAYEQLLAERGAIAKSDDQTKVDAWRLAVGRAIDALSSADGVRQTDMYVLPPASPAIAEEGAQARKRFAGTLKRNRLIGHRGDSEAAPENTLPALRAAIEQGFGVETDIYVTKDGMGVMFHDRYIHRGKYDVDGWVTNLAWRGGLETVDAGSWKGPQWKDVRFATLDDVLALAADGQEIFLDVKDGDNMVETILAAVRRHPNVNPSNLVFLSGGWLHSRLPAYRDFKAGRPRQGWWVTDPPRDLFADAAKLDPAKISAWNLRWDEELVTKELIDFVHARGLKVCLWTINDAMSAWTAFGRGADWVCTDRPTSLWAEMHGEMKVSR